MTELLGQNQIQSAELEKINVIIRSLKSNGLFGDMNIVIAIDTSINKQLIVDGTNRSLVLYYLCKKEEASFLGLLDSKSSIRNYTQIRCL